MATAMEFCRSSPYPQIYLLTFEGLDAARALYERHGFQLTTAHQVRQLGQELKEQQFVLALPPRD